MKKLTKEKLLNTCLGILILGFILIIMTGVAYSYPSEDDFGFEASANEEAARRGYLLGGLKVAIVFYNNAQGTWFYNYIMHSIAPYTRWGQPGFHALMLAMAALFFISLFIFLKLLILKPYDDKNTYTSGPGSHSEKDDRTNKGRISALAERRYTPVLIFMLCSMWGFFQVKGSGIYSELFFCYTCVMNYTLELSLAFLSVSFFLLLLRKQSTVYLIAGMLTGFLASGGTTEIASPNCAWLLLLLVIHFDEVKKRKILALPFLSAFAGALLNVAAPGNYKLADSLMKDGHSSLFDALRDTAVCFGKETVTMLQRPVFLVLLSIVFLTAVYFGIRVLPEGRMNLIKLILAVPVTVLIQFFTMFPVILGHHVPDLDSMRTTGTSRMVATLMYFFLMVCLAPWMRESLYAGAGGQSSDDTLKNLTGKGMVRLLPAIVLIILALLSGITHPARFRKDFKDGFIYRIAEDIADGTMREAYNVRLFALSSMELAPEGTDFVLELPYIKTRSMYGMGLTDDPNSPINVSAAKYYHLKSVVFDYTGM